MEQRDTRRKKGRTGKGRVRMSTPERLEAMFCRWADERERRQRDQEAPSQEVLVARDIFRQFRMAMLGHAGFFAELVLPRREIHLGTLSAQGMMPLPMSHAPLALAGGMH